MFSEIYSNRQEKAYQTWAIIICSVAVTTATLLTDNLAFVFGSRNADTGWANRLTLIFQHGFDDLSAIVHLIVDITLLILIGLFTEKLLGPRMFFTLTVSSIVFYAMVHGLFKMTGHGATGIIWAYLPTIYYALGEGRLIKTRSVFDDYYRLLKNLLLIMVLLFPLLMSIIPIHFASELPVWKSFLYGNVFHISSLLWALLFIILYKERVRERMKHFAKKKKFELEGPAQLSLYFSLFYPLIIIAGFVLKRL